MCDVRKAMIMFQPHRGQKSPNMRLEAVFTPYSRVGSAQLTIIRASRRTGAGAQMRQKIYVETSVVSYLTARPSRDLVTAARQALTRDWWESAPERWDLAISALVIEEAARGDPTAAAHRLQALRELSSLPIGTHARDLAATLVQSGIVPTSEPEDALHVAIATVSEMQYLVTWNFAHLAGPDAKQKLLDGLRNLGHNPPLLTTPEELLEITK